MEAWVGGGLLQSWGTECSSTCVESFERGCHYLHYLHHSLVNSREGTQLHLSTENWVKDLLSMSLPIRTRPSFPLHQSLPSGIFHKPLILLHQRADRLKTTILTVRLSLIKKTRVHTFFKEVKKRDSLCNVGENVN